jgi:hypothetical protein
MDVRFFETLHESDVAIGATRETGTILSFAVRAEHEIVCAPKCSRRS